MNSRRWAAAAGTVVGAVLFAAAGGINATSLGLNRWFQLAAFLAGFGLAGVFRQARRAAVAGVALAPCVVAAVQTGVQMSRDSGCCNLWPIGLVLAIAVGAPAPIAGGFANRLLDRARLPRLISVIAVVGAMAIAVLSPAIMRAERRRLERVEIPRLMNRIYAAEMAYAAQQPDAGFTCDGVKLPDVGKFGWTDDGRQTIHNLLIVQKTVKSFQRY